MDLASSDEEGEIIPGCVTNFHFTDDKNAPVSFCALPLQWGDEEMSEGSKSDIFLHGNADNGLQQVFRRVTAWKFELSYVLPEIYVLTKENIWIKLYRPRKSYELFIRTIFVAVHFLHFVKKNFAEPREVVWCHMLKVMSAYEVQPSEDDLLPHIPIIEEAARRDKDVSKSEYMINFLSSTHGDKAILGEAQKNCVPRRTKFVVDAVDDEDIEDDYDGDSDEEAGQLFDSVCAYCDDGGEIICCEGRCIRSFHPTIKSGAESFCESLGYNHEQTDVFLCKNCQYHQHQCFACGLLGSSDQFFGAEVFPCVSAICGHFYHPKCVSKLLHPSDETQAAGLEKEIAEGESFTCPLHICFVCKQIEDSTVHELQFGICRRCPKAYHRKCLPRTIGFESDPENKVQMRAWEGLLHNRILIYCMDHKILPQIGTPRRDHLLFPEGDAKKHQACPGTIPDKVIVSVRRSKTFGSFQEESAVKAIKPLQGMGRTIKPPQGMERTIKPRQGMGRNNNISVEKIVKGLPKAPTEKLGKINSIDYQMSLKGKTSKFSTVGKGHSSELNQQPKSQLPLESYSKMQHKFDGEPTSPPKVRPAMNEARAKLELRVADLIKSCNASFDAEGFLKEKKRKCLNSYSPRCVQGKSITMEMVEHAVKAIRVACKKLEDGGTIEEARMICPPEVLNHIVRWKRKLKVYLAPFLHGARYTSFGRHFTKPNKLKEVVERLKWYAQDGDMIVDFCCGSNDFSCLMKEALDNLGKKCSFKNYDLLRPKNDFNYEMRDWMSVRPGELPSGSNLIMGLNPPFGVNASLANKFIEKALTFNPKLLILIVPKETQRLDQKKFPYDLIWEDDELLSGKSFYLPGSVDANNQQIEQWNLDTPPLYLWSHPDWTRVHRAIAEEHGHIRTDQAFGEFNRRGIQNTISNYLMEDNQDCFGDFSGIMKGYGDISNILYDIPELPFELGYEKMSHGHNDRRYAMQCESSHMSHEQNDRQTEMQWGCNQNAAGHLSHARDDSQFRMDNACNQHDVCPHSDDEMVDMDTSA